MVTSCVGALAGWTKWKKEGSPNWEIRSERTDFTQKVDSVVENMWPRGVCSTLSVSHLALFSGVQSAVSKGPSHGAGTKSL